MWRVCASTPPATDTTNHCAKQDLVEPNAIDVSFKDIGGLSAVCDELKQALVVPLQFPLLFIASKLTRPPLGVLLHGEHAETSLSLSLSRLVHST